MTSRSSHSILCFVVCAALGGGSSACTVQRPKGAYDPPPLARKEEPAEVPSDATLATREEAGVPDIPGIVPPPMNDAGTTADAGISVDPPDPLDALQGDYLLRADSESSVDDSSLGKTTTTTTAFGVMRVVRTEQGLLGHERLCHMDVTQDAQDARSIETRVDDRVWANLAAVERPLTVDLQAGTWSAAPATRRQGWKAAAGDMPTDVATQLELFIDHDDSGYPGVETEVHVEKTLVTQATCTYDIVSSVTTRLVDGTLEGGLLADAEVEVVDSKPYALRARGDNPLAECDVNDVNVAPEEEITEDSMRLSRVEGQVLDDPTFCPTEQEFRSALP